MVNLLSNTLQTRVLCEIKWAYLKALISWVLHTSQHVKHARTRGSGGMPPPGNFWKIDAKYCNLETFPHKMHIAV